MIIKTIYNIGEVVFIPSIKLEGVIVVIQYSIEGLYYKINYFANSVQQTAWIYENEIRKIGNSNE